MYDSREFVISFGGRNYIERPAISIFNVFFYINIILYLSSSNFRNDSYLMTNKLSQISCAIDLVLCAAFE